MAQQGEHILNFLLYLAVTLPLLGIGLLMFIFTTPFSEMKIMREGTSGAEEWKKDAAKAVAYSLGGKILGLSLVLASAVYHSLGIQDLVVWGLVGAAFQVVVFYVFELVTPFKVIREIPQGNVAVGIFSSQLSLASGLLMAALISY